MRKRAGRSMFPLWCSPFVVRRPLVFRIGRVIVNLTMWTIHDLPPQLWQILETGEFSWQQKGGAIVLSVSGQRGESHGALPVWAMPSAIRTHFCLTPMGKEFLAGLF